MKNEIEPCMVKGRMGDLAELTLEIKELIAVSRDISLHTNNLLHKVKSNEPCDDPTKPQEIIYEISIVGTLQETKDNLIKVIELQKINASKLESLL